MSYNLSDFCEHCGGLVRIGSSYCRYCGSLLNTQVIPVNSRSPALPNSAGISTYIQSIDQSHSVAVFQTQGFNQLQPATRLDMGLLLLEGRIVRLKYNWAYIDPAEVKGHVVGYSRALESLYLDVAIEGLDINPYRTKILTLQQKLAIIEGEAAKQNLYQVQSFSSLLNELDVWTEYLKESISHSGIEILKASLDHCKQKLTKVLQILQQSPIDISPNSPHYEVLKRIRLRILEAEREIKQKAVGRGSVWQGVVSFAYDVVGVAHKISRWIP